MSAAVIDTGEKRVGWAELFFDLVFVFAVTEVSSVLEDDHSWAGLLRALIVFVPIYWMWVGASIQTNLRDSNQPGLRLTIFAVALAAVFGALALPEAYGRLGMLYACAYWAGRMTLGSALLRSAMRTRTLPLNPYGVSMFVTGPLLVCGALVHGSAREVVWGLAALLDLSTPRILRVRMQQMHVDPAHFAERFGLFVLITLGESVVAVGSSARQGEVTVAVGFAVAAAFVLVCGLWWIYFHFAADAVRHALSTATVQLDIIRLVFSYGHLAFIAAIIVAAVGIRESVAHPGDHLSAGAAGMLFGGTATYVATFGFTRWTMFRLVSYTRLTTAAVIVALLPIAPHVPALAALSALAVVMVIVNAVELIRVEHTGWFAALSRRSSTAALPRPVREDD
jgi:low temperature requirement protein LtrA